MLINNPECESSQSNEEENGRIKVNEYSSKTLGWMRDLLVFLVLFFQFNEADCLQNVNEWLSVVIFFLNDLSALFRPTIIFAKIVEELFHSNRCDCSFLLRYK